MATINPELPGATGGVPTPATPTADFAASPNVLPSDTNLPAGALDMSVAELGKYFQAQMDEDRGEQDKNLNTAISQVNSQIQDFIDFKLPKASWSERAFNGNYKSERVIEEARIKSDALKTLLPTLEKLLTEKRLLNELDPIQEAYMKAVGSLAGSALKRADMKQGIEKYRGEGGVVSKQKEFELLRDIDLPDDIGPQYPTVTEMNQAHTLGKALADPSKAGLAFDDESDRFGLLRDMAKAGAEEALRLRRVKAEKAAADLAYRDAGDDLKAQEKAQTKIDKAESEAFFADGYKTIDDAFKAIESQIKFLIGNGVIETEPKIYEYSKEDKFDVGNQRYQETAQRWAPTKEWTLRRQIAVAADQKGLTASLPKMYPLLFAPLKSEADPSQARQQRLLELRKLRTE